MGLDVPMPAASDEENEATENEATQNLNFSEAFNDSVNIGDDSALILEERTKSALECPCLADLVNGPCGEELSEAFGCFIKSQEPAKGSDCVEPFEKMQKCMTINAGEFSSMDNSDSHLSSIEEEDRRQTEKNLEIESDDKGKEVSGLRNGTHELPEVRDKSVRLPLWSRTEDSEDQRSR